jgi:hypothetical protein
LLKSLKTRFCNLSLNGACNENSALQERITKACPYFIEKLGAIITEPFEKLVIETDNRRLEKNLTKL